MTFEEIVERAIDMALLKRGSRVTYRMLKRQFDLDNDFIADLKSEKLYAQPVTDDLTATDRRKGENP